MSTEREPAAGADGTSAWEDEVMRLTSSDNPRSRRHDEDTPGRRSMWRCVPISDIAWLRNAALAQPAPVAASADLDAAWKALIATALRRNAVVAVGEHRAAVEAATIAAHGDLLNGDSPTPRPGSDDVVGARDPAALRTRIQLEAPDPPPSVASVAVPPAAADVRAPRSSAEPS